MKKIILPFLCLISFSLLSQNLEWAHRIGGSYEDNCFDMAIDSLDNIYLTGGICNSVNFNLNGGSDIIS